MPFGCMSMERLGAKYAEVGCKSMERLGAKYAVVGCKSMDTFATCNDESILPHSPTAAEMHTIINGSSLTRVGVASMALPALSANAAAISRGTTPLPLQPMALEDFIKFSSQSNNKKL